MVCGSFATLHKQTLLFFSCNDALQGLTGSGSVGKHSNSNLSFSSSKWKQFHFTSFSRINHLVKKNVCFLHFGVMSNPFASLVMQARMQ